MSGPDPIRYTTLHQCGLVSVQDYVCRASAGGPSGEEEHRRNSVVLLRHGAFRQHFGRTSVVADVNQAVFFTKGSTPRVSHPADCGDRGTVFAISPEVLHEIVRELDPSVDERPERPFPFAVGPCRTATDARHRELVRRLGAPAVDPLWASEEALGLCADVLASAFARPAARQYVRKSATAIDHADRVEAAKAFLARNLSERVTLEGMARAAALSPFHFSRVFRNHTGLPAHRYLRRLRLRTALDRLAGGALDLATLALDLGFATHAHFTEAFRREYGLTPSEYRRAAPSARKFAGIR